MIQVLDINIGNPGSKQVAHRTNLKSAYPWYFLCNLAEKYYFSLHRWAGETNLKILFLTSFEELLSQKKMFVILCEGTAGIPDESSCFEDFVKTQRSRWCLLKCSYIPHLKILFQTKGWDWKARNKISFCLYHIIVIQHAGISDESHLLHCAKTWKCCVLLKNYVYVLRLPLGIYLINYNPCHAIKEISLTAVPV